MGIILPFHAKSISGSNYFKRGTMLKSCKTLLAVLLMIAVSVPLPVSASPKTLDFLFYSAPSVFHRSVYLEEWFEQAYEANFNMTMILLETPSLDDSRYLKQMEILESLPDGMAEKLEFIYVVSCWTKEYRDGYHTKLETARRLAEGHNDFRVRFLDGRGKVLFTSSDVLTADEIISMVRDRRVGVQSPTTPLAWQVSNINSNNNRIAALRSQ